MIERFNGNYRREVLSAHLFTELNQVRDETQKWIWDYNNIRPHQSLGNKPPLQFVSNQSPSLEIDKHLTEETIFTNAAV